MNRLKCYENQIGESFDDCVTSIMDELKGRRYRVVLLVFDGIPLRITKKSTYKDVKYKYMVESSKQKVL